MQFDAPLIVQLRSLEAQLAILRTRLKRTASSRKAFSAFYGILADVAKTTDAEIDASKLKTKTI